MLASEYRYTYLRTTRTASLFKNPIVRQILVSSGNIPVDRKNKDRRGLFQGTIEALSRGSVVALFPEGTSYTEPRIMQVKDGASWAALEYTKWAHENPSRATKDPLVIVPSAIVYTNKSKYRSYVRYVPELLHRYTRSDSVFIGHPGVRPLDNPYPGYLRINILSSRFGPPISMDPYLDQFLSPEEGAPRAAVKRLTKTIEARLVELTINAPDW